MRQPTKAEWVEWLAKQKKEVGDCREVDGTNDGFNSHYVAFHDGQLKQIEACELFLKGMLR